MGRKLGGAAGERLCRDAHARRNDDAADIRLGIDHSKGCGSTEVHDGQRAFELTAGACHIADHIRSQLGGIVCQDAEAGCGVPGPQCGCSTDVNRPSA